MSSYVPRPRDTILVPNTGGIANPKGKHLHIVLTEISQQNDLLLVPICSYYSKCDNACLLNENDHEFLDHKSYIKYQNTQKFNSNHIIRMITIGNMWPKEKCRQDVFARVCHGLIESPMTPLFAKKYLKENWPSAYFPTAP